MATIDYYQIAQVQIDCAIRLFYERDYICALTLAGAAEDVLGGLIKSNEGLHVRDDLNKIIREKYPDLSDKLIGDTLNRSRNMFKHFIDDDAELNFKPFDDSLLMILRAMSNYCKVRNAMTETMINFANDSYITSELKKISL